MTRAEVSKGRIQRFLTDENNYTSDGTYIDPESRNFPQTRSCARCRSYKYRLYHPGRLLYPMKQTVKRGDLSGFKRITWEQALEGIAKKHKAVLDKYGVDGIYSIYAWGAATGQFQGASGGPLGAGGAGGAGGAALRYMGGAQSSYFGSYSTHQYRYFGVKYTGADENVNVNSVAKHANNVVFWGDNTPSTVNPSSYGNIRAIEDMKKRNPAAQAYYVGPEFSDGGVVMADNWIVSKPFTDPALIAGMIYHMLENTFDLTTGQIKSEPWLDVNYLDTMVYGFFDSPEYGLNDTSGEIDASPSHAGDRVVPAVPAGRSYCSWILGNNDSAQTYSALGASGNYTAARFAADADMKRWAPCSYEVKGVSGGAGSDYLTKQDYRTPKTPEWASAITGVPVETIKKLAEVYALNGPVTSTWSGGQQKQADGIANLFALQSLHVVTKNVGKKGAGVIWHITPSVIKDSGALKIKVDHPDVARFPNMEKALASCTAWHTVIKMAFAKELADNGYIAKYIPNYQKGTDTTDSVYWDDGGTKTFIKWKRNPDTGAIETYSDGGDTFYKWDGYDEGLPPVVSGIRLMYNTGGNIFINQHENSNDSKEMLEYLNLDDGSADTFCLVSFDNFMSPTVRWSDYVLPAATSWEQQDIMAPTNGTDFYIPQVITPPGESKPTWDFANELLKTYEKVDPSASGAARDFTGGVADKPVEAFVRDAFREACATPESPFYGMKWEEFIQKPFLPAKADDYTVPVPARMAFMDNYISADKTLPFVKPAVEGYYADTNEITDGGYGNEFSNTDGAPKSPRRFQTYSPVLVWQYENKFSKWHGYLQSGQRGQRHKDIEGDRFVIEIPVYYAYQDYFMEAYGGKDNLNDLSFLLTTTHDRYRSHSSMAENPMLRELTHRVPGRDAKGNYRQANDYNDYSMPPSQAFAVNEGGVIPELNRTIGEGGEVTAENKDIASYSEIWINDTDGRELIGLEDGDLVQVENPIGAVRCVARLTKRCARGFVGLHQGCWYDPRTIDGKLVDVGGNCNTLMASQPSRIDHGNGQQSAMVKITKVNY